MNPALRVAAVLGAAALAVPVIASFEGWEPVGYRDPIGIPTACYGHTGGVTLGTRYDQAVCESWLAVDTVKHGLDIAPCLPAELPTKTRAAFTSFAFNVGSAKACGSTMFRKARAGDLAGACAELSRWTYAKGRQLAGLVRRRAKEKALCLEGLGGA